MDNITFTPRMYAILHKQICDNYFECPAKIACEKESRKRNSHPAIYMDENHRLTVNKDLCNGCGRCSEQCGLFRIVTPYQEREKQEEFDADPRNELDFTAERFGCDIINREEYLLENLQEVNEFIGVGQDGRINILEFVDDAQAICPFQAIEVDYVMKLFPNLGQYKKFIIKPTEKTTFTELMETFEIDRFPAIILIRNGKILGTPITNEYRLKNESDRIKMQNKLYKDFAERLEG